MKMPCISGTEKLFSRRDFTLLELTIVLAIIIIFSVVIVANISIPTFATLDGTTKKIQKLFGDAQRQTALQGVEINVLYYSETRELKLMTHSSGNSSEGNQTLPDTEIEQPVSNSQFTLKIPAKIGVDFPDYEEDVIQYRFFPDGSASGPEMILTLSGRKVLIGISRLTGMSYSREEE